MNVRRLVSIAGAAATAVLAFTATAVSAPGASATTDDAVRSAQQAAYDAYPCLPAYYHSGVGRYVQTCPDWGPANGPWGDRMIPVYGSNLTTQVGTIYAPGNDWYVCQLQMTHIDPFPYGGYYNDWWAYTKADNGQWGWVPEVFFSGGGNLDPDRKLAMC